MFEIAIAGFGAIGQELVRALSGEPGVRIAQILVPAHALEAARAAGFAGELRAAPEFSEAFAAEIAALVPSGTSVLLKGSRGARMERFLDPLRSAFATA